MALMKKTCFLVAILIAAFSAWMFQRWWSRDPSAAFYRHFDMWPPGTVRELVRGGSTSFELASADEYLVFAGTPQDIDRVIQKGNFEYVGRWPRESKHLSEDGWRHAISFAKKRGVRAERLYEAGIGREVSYVLITNADATRAFYQFER
jgi:hypothetical protein